MRRTLSCLISLLFCAVPAVSQNPSNSVAKRSTRSALNSDTELIQQIEDDWLKAERKTDATLLDRILAADFGGVGPNGLTPDKTQLLKNWQPNPVRLLPMP